MKSILSWVFAGEDAPRIIPALDSLSADAITHPINTHLHVDHTDGDSRLHEAGVSITADENTKRHLSMLTCIEG